MSATPYPATATNVGVDHLRFRTIRRRQGGTRYRVELTPQATGTIAGTTVGYVERAEVGAWQWVSLGHPDTPAVTGGAYARRAAAAQALAARFLAVREAEADVEEMAATAEVVEPETFPDYLDHGADVEVAEEAPAADPSPNASYTTTNLADAYAVAVTRAMNVNRYVAPAPAPAPVAEEAPAADTVDLISAEVAAVGSPEAMRGLAVVGATGLERRHLAPRLGDLDAGPDTLCGMAGFDLEVLNGDLFGATCAECIDAARARVAAPAVEEPAAPVLPAGRDRDGLAVFAGERVTLAAWGVGGARKRDVHRTGEVLVASTASTAHVRLDATATRPAEVVSAPWRLWVMEAPAPAPAAEVALTGVLADAHFAAEATAAADDTTGERARLAARAFADADDAADLAGRRVLAADEVSAAARALAVANDRALAAAVLDLLRATWNIARHARPSEGEVGPTALIGWRATPAEADHLDAIAARLGSGATRTDALRWLVGTVGDVLAATGRA